MTWTGDGRGFFCGCKVDVDLVVVNEWMQHAKVCEEERHES